MTDQTKNSAEATLELRAAMRKLEDSMTSGVSKDSASLALQVSILSGALLEIVVEEQNARTSRKTARGRLTIEHREGILPTW